MLCIQTFQPSILAMLLTLEVGHQSPWVGGPCLGARGQSPGAHTLPCLGRPRCCEGRTAHSHVEVPAWVRVPLGLRKVQRSDEIHGVELQLSCAAPHPCKVI